MKKINSKDTFNKYNGKEEVKETKKTPQSVITVFIIIGLIGWLFFSSGKTDSDTQDTTSTYKTSTTKHSNDCRWCEMLTFAILKNNNNKVVHCREKFTNGGNYILCTYQTAGYNKKALFMNGNDKVYAINGTARAKEFTNYSDVELYDISKNGSVDIHSILSNF